MYFNFVIIAIFIILAIVIFILLNVRLKNKTHAITYKGLQHKMNSQLRLDTDICSNIFTSQTGKSQIHRKVSILKE